MALNADGHRPRLINGKRVASSEYRCWQMMKNRCLNPRAMDWKYYGGRGITIDPRWLSFDAFLADMGTQPAKGMTIERRKSDLPYGPDNCEWATRETQSRSRNYCKLSPEKAAELRRRLAAGELQVALATEFNISQSRVSQIGRGMGWT